MEVYPRNSQVLAREEGEIGKEQLKGKKEDIAENGGRETVLEGNVESGKRKMKKLEKRRKAN